MFSQITFQYGNYVVKGILLGEYELLLPWVTYEKKKFLFFSYTKKRQTTVKRKEYLVFVPWKHALKELICVDELMVISKENTPTDWTHVDHYISKFDKELPYISELEVENFHGYSFLVENNSLLSDIHNGCRQDVLGILYQHFPDILLEELDEEEIGKNHVLFAKNNERKGTAYIELQFCKKAMSRKQALKLKNIHNWKEDSLYIPADHISLFCRQYLDIFRKATGSSFDICGMEYYSFEQVKMLRDLILERKPLDYPVIVSWLDQCIENKNSLYFLGI